MLFSAGTKVVPRLFSAGTRLYQCCSVLAARLYQCCLVLAARLYQCCLVLAQGCTNVVQCWHNAAMENTGTNGSYHSLILKTVLYIVPFSSP